VAVVGGEPGVLRAAGNGRMVVRVPVRGLLARRGCPVLRQSFKESKARPLTAVLQTVTPGSVKAHVRTIRLVEIAELLGVSKQRVHQIADEEGFPPPVAEDGRGRLWNPREVQAWAKRWHSAKPWR
jgi:predicted DNA-binding transcriptional regulator AlpA